MAQEVCKCGCEKDRHYSERVSTGDVTKLADREPHYFACLIVHCDCKKFVQDTRK